MKILIADDDSLMRIALKTLVNWEEHGFTLLEEAADGVEALSIIRRDRPDILLLDIKMPGMDGIQVLRELKGMPCRPRTVVLSSYDEFDLVRTAMKLGAEDYLLKMDLDFDKLAPMLEQLTEQVLSSRRANAAGETTRLDSQRSARLLRGEFYRTLASRFYLSAADLEEERRALDIHLGEGFNYCFLLKCSVPDGGALSVMPYAVINVAEEILSGGVTSFGLEWSGGEFCVFASPTNRAEGLDREQLLEYGRRLAEMLQEYLNLTVFVGVGEGEGGIPGAQMAYDRARMVIFDRFFMDEDRVALWSGTDRPGQPEEAPTLLGRKEELFRGLAGRNREQVLRIFGEIGADIGAKRYGREAVGSLLQQLYYLIWECLETSSIQAETVLKGSLWPTGRTMLFDTFREALDYLERLEGDVANWMASAGGSGGLEAALRYIQAHYGEELSLGQVAGAVGLNPTYLSYLMKRETGRSYSEYLIGLRIQRAKELMKAGQGKIYQIGEKVGYPNTFYFARLFKRETGMTPGEYMTAAGNENRREHHN